MEWINQEIIDCYECYIYENQWCIHYEICSHHCQMFRNDLNKIKSMEWISVEDSLPEKDENVLVVPRCGPICIACIVGLNSSGNPEWFATDGACVFSGVIYWMPLPKVPDEM